jgi:hypothetical protein
MKIIRKKILSAEGGDEKNKSKTIINKNWFFLILVLGIVMDDDYIYLWIL